MKVSRELYYCTFTDDNDKLPKFSPPFTTESGARREAKKLSQQGYWGAIEKHCEFKQDYENDYAWHVDWEGYGDTIEMIEYFNETLVRTAYPVRGSFHVQTYRSL